MNAEVGEYLPAWHKYEDYRQMYASKKELGGGVILSQIHEMDYLYSWFGLPSRICALGGHLSSLEIDVEDVASIMMEYNNGERVMPVHVHQDYVQRPSRRGCSIIGDAGRIDFDLAGSTLKVFDQEGSLTEEADYADLDRNSLFMGELKHFAECVEKREQTTATLSDGAASLKMAMAAKRSLESKQWESL